MKLGMSLPVWRGLAVLAAVLLAVPAGGAAGAGMPAAHCRDVRATRAALCRFVAAVNNGNLRRLLAPARQFRHYSVQGPTGVDTGDRAALLAYASGRRGHSEKLRLTWFSLNRSPRDVPSFRFDVVRGADDLALPTLYPGSAKLRCAARCRLVALTMAPNVEPPRPAPATYAETCKLVGPTWCEDTPTPGGIPSDLRRPLRLPTVRPGQPCPVTEPRRFDGDRFGGLALEDGPVAPLIAPGWVHPDGIHFYTLDSSGWYGVKTLWFSMPQYQGPVLIRGRQLDGPHKIVMGEGPDLVDPQLGPGATLNGLDGWREWPGGTLVRTPGCYAWQIDGTDFSNIVVFQAVFP